MPLWAPPWASWFLFIISLNPHSLCNEAGSVIPGFSRRKPRLWEGVAALSRGGGGSWTPRVCLQSPACWGSHSRPFGQGFLSCHPATRVSPTLSGCTSLCPLPTGLGSQLRFLSGCHPGDKVWLQERAGVEWVAGGVGSSVSQEWGPGAPAAMRYPPRECGLAAPPSESQGPELLGAPSKPVVLLPAGHPPSHR